MDEPVPSRLRPARHRGLTRPDPVTALPWPQRPPASTFPSRRPGQAAEHVSGPAATPGTIKIVYLPASTSLDEQQNLRGGSRLSPPIRPPPSGDQSDHVSGMLHHFIVISDLPSRILRLHDRFGTPSEIVLFSAGIFDVGRSLIDQLRS